MPRRVRRRGFQSQRELSSAQWLELMVGPFPKRSAFRDDEARRRAFREHEDELLHSWAWVTYRAGGFLPEEGGRVTRALQRLGVAGRGQA